MWAGLKSFGWGLKRMLTCVIFGIVSLLVWGWRYACKFVGKYPNIALGGFIVIVTLVWFVTFVKMRHRAVSAEYQRDHVVWQFTDFKRQHGYE